MKGDVNCLMVSSLFSQLPESVISITFQTIPLIIDNKDVVAMARTGID